MGLWDDIGGMFSGGGWIGPAVMAGATLYGAQQTADANVEAAQIAAQAQQQQAAAVAAGNKAAQQRFETMQQEAQPARSYLQSVMATDPGQLTPQQETQRADLRRQVTSNVAVSGLRGAGRTGVALMNKSDADFYDQAVKSNQARADSAASGLASQYTQAGTAAANLDAATGQAAGSAAGQSGLFTAQAGLANTKANASAIGDVASIIASDVKDRTRESRYDNRLNQILGAQKQ